MTPEAIIRQAEADGVKLSLSATPGNVSIAGERAAVDRWLGALREHKPEVIEVLKWRRFKQALLIGAAQ